MKRRFPSLEVAFFDVVEILHLVVSVNRYIVPINFSELNLNYQFLFYKQHQFCKSHQDRIRKNAERVYTCTVRKGTKISQFHCDYVLLEKEMHTL